MSQYKIRGLGMVKLNIITEDIFVSGDFIKRYWLEISPQSLREIADKMEEQLNFSDKMGEQKTKERKIVVNASNEETRVAGLPDVIFCWRPKK